MNQIIKGKSYTFKRADRNRVLVADHMGHPAGVVIYFEYSGRSTIIGCPMSWDSQARAEAIIAAGKVE